MNKKNFDPAVLAGNIENLLEEKGMTKKEFADSIDAHASNISDFLNYPNGKPPVPGDKDATIDKKSITIKQLYNIATVYGVSADELLGITPSAKSTNVQVLAVKDILEGLIYLVSNGLVSYEVIYKEEPYIYYDDDGELQRTIAPKHYQAIYFQEYIFPNTYKDEDEFLQIVEHDNSKSNKVSVSVEVNKYLSRLINYYSEYVQDNREHKRNFDKKIAMMLEEVEDIALQDLKTNK